jgi:hypothetical protein
MAKKIKGKLFVAGKQISDYSSVLVTSKELPVEEVNVVFIDGEDWQGLYIRGVLVDQGSSLCWPYVIEQFLVKKTIGTFDQWCPDEGWLQKRGVLPTLLKDVKLA